MNYWITTDTHFGHKKLIDEEARPINFESSILKRLKDVLRPDDILIHLGDVSFKDDKKWHSMLIELSPCKKWLILGNHDSHSDTWYMKHGWDFVADAEPA